MNNRFKTGSGCYKCRCCGRMTRATGAGDAEHILMCSQCYDMGGIENQLQDGNYDSETEREALIKEIRYLAQVIVQKGGTPKSDYI